MNRSTVAAAALLSTLLAGCAGPGYGPGTTQTVPPQGYPAQAYPAQTQPSNIVAYGRVESIQPVRSDGGGIGGSGIGLGTVAGGVVGGLLGSQVGSGSGKTAATVAGAVGGAALGSGMQSRAATVYQVGVRLDNGNFVTLMRESAADLQIGARVGIDSSNRIYRY